MILCGDDIVLLLYADQQIKRMNSGPESHLRRGKIKIDKPVGLFGQAFVRLPVDHSDEL